ncbi:SulfHydrylase FUB7 [Hyphodiscus hymeniophilus]|uniref:SulfHydrylase FUB7 n=1 Tax=Hyphodiscus hymeniophilus TaxID=353542 RepID=A0A9P6VI84_9HELO|nr:SulfHydrylase FUB7 [Hyphodiscus hymeniophilus]
MAESTNPGKLSLHFESLSVHAGLNRSENEVKDIPVHATSPTVDVFEKRMAALEAGEAALATAFALPLPLGNPPRFIPSGDLDSVKKSIDENTKAVFVESISTNDLLIADIEALSTVARENGVPLIVDNTNGAGGLFIRPISHGASIVLHSTAPWLSISGSSTGGVIIDSGTFSWAAHPDHFPQFSDPSPGFHGLRISEKFGNLALVRFARIAVMRDAGPCLNPFEAAVLLAGLETLAVKMDRVAENAKGICGVAGETGEGCRCEVSR